MPCRWVHKKASERCPILPISWLHRLLLWVWFFGGLSFGVERLGAAELGLVTDGVAKARIVISEKPLRTVRLAAHELQTYVEKISGVLDIDSEVGVGTTITDSTLHRLP